MITFESKEPRKLKKKIKNKVNKIINSHEDAYIYKDSFISEAKNSGFIISTKPLLK